jgi:hypothetical protein
VSSSSVSIRCMLISSLYISVGTQKTSSTVQMLLFGVSALVWNPFDRVAALESTAHN